MIKHIMFDFDGTIADSYDVGIAILFKMIDKHNLRKISIDELEELKGHSIKSRFKYIGVPLRKIPRISKDVFAEIKEQVPSLLPYKDIRQVLYDLKDQGYLLSILSSNSTDVIQEFLKINDLQIFEEVIVSNGLFNKQKYIKKYIKKYNLDKKQLIYVGDEQRDINSCKKADIDMIAVSWGFDPIALLKIGKPKYLIDSPLELLPIINS